MTPEEVSAGCPDTIPIGGSELRYALSTTQCAIPLRNAGSDTSQPIFHHADRSWKVVPITEAAEQAEALPVYEKDRDYGVATGTLFVRLASGERIDARRSDLEAIGLRLQSALSYAPQAGWVDAAGADRSAALMAIEALCQLPGVEHVEAQLLRPASKRR